MSSGKQKSDSMRMFEWAIISFALLGSCRASGTQQETTNTAGTNASPLPPPSSGWSIPVENVLDGGPGKDGIAAMENPVFTSAQNKSILRDSDLVLGYKNGDDVRAYPHIILNWHEIVNDDIGDVSLAVTYCPLTGTGIGWNRIVNLKKTTFGVSGLLFNSNLIPYDRETGSNWSQILNESVNGELLGVQASLVQLVETDWKTWRTMYPNTRVLSPNTGFTRDYRVYPYSDYRTNHDFLIFPVPKDGRLPSKERVHAIIDGKAARVYRFPNRISYEVIRDTFNGKDYLVVGNHSFIVSFELDAESATLHFNYAFSGSQVILTDDEGNQWNIFGAAIHGPRTGKKLKASNSFMGYWFAFPAFYATDLYGS